MIFDKIVSVIAEKTGLNPELITLDSDFTDDLNIDSLDIFEIIMDLEDEYSLEIPTEDLEGMRKVSDLVSYLDRKLS
ncbi:MAG: acyl carrier protein [Desulfitobacteriia bacterium]|jgi:acyl carrier protein